MGTKANISRCLLLILFILVSVAILLENGGEPSLRCRNAFLIRHNCRHKEFSHSSNVFCVFVFFFMLQRVLFMSMMLHVHAQKTAICTSVKQLWMSFVFTTVKSLHNLPSDDKRTTSNLERRCQNRNVIIGFHRFFETEKDEVVTNYKSNHIYLLCEFATTHSVNCDADYQGNILSKIIKLLLNGFICDIFCERQVVLIADHIRWGGLGNVHVGMGRRHFKDSSLHRVIPRDVSISSYGEAQCRKSFTSTSFGNAIKCPVSRYDTIVVDTRCKCPVADFGAVVFDATCRCPLTRSSNKRIARKFDATEISTKHACQQELEWVIRPVTRFLPDVTNNPSVDLAHVGYRLATLSALPPSVPGSRVRFADAGFYFRGQGDELICYKCQVRHSGWTSEDNPIEVHRRISPNCPHVTERIRELAATAAYLGNTNNDNEQQSSSSSFRTTFAGGNTMVSGISAGLANLSTDEPQQESNSCSQSQQTAEADTTARISSSRLVSNPEIRQAAPVVSVPKGASSSASFTSAAVQTSQGSATGLRPEPAQEAKALFRQPTLHASSAGVVGGMGGGMSSGGSSISKSESRVGGGDGNTNASRRSGSGGSGSFSNASPRAGAVGSLSGPRMGLLGGTPLVSFPSILENSRADSNTSSSRPISNQRNSRNSAESGGSAQGGGTGVQRGGAANMFPRAALELGGAVYPMYQDMASRRRSFASWDETHAPPLDQIILCGMFYAGYADCVRCFYCGVGLKHFEVTDDVWAEHIRLRPTCGYLRAVKGDDFIRRTQAQLSRESRQEEEDSELDNGARNAQAPANPRPSPPGVPSLIRQRGTTPALPVTPQSNASVTSPLPAGATTSVSQSLTQIPVATASTVTSEQAAVTSLSTSVSSPPVSATASAGSATTSNASESPPESFSSRQASSTVPDRVEASSVVAQYDETHAQRVVRLQAENRELARRLRCKVCHREPIDTILMPCGHLVACEACARDITQCPLCYGRIRATAKVHLN